MIEQGGAGPRREHGLDRGPRARRPRTASTRRRSTPSSASRECLRLDLEPHGIGVSVLCPGPVKTGILKSERNRPTELGTSKLSREDLTAVMRGGDAANCDLHRARPPPPRAVLDAVRRNEPYVITHPGSKALVESRFARPPRRLRHRPLPQPRPPVTQEGVGPLLKARVIQRLRLIRRRDDDAHPRAALGEEGARALRRCAPRSRRRAPRRARLEGRRRARRALLDAHRVPPERGAQRTRPLADRRGEERRRELAAEEPRDRRLRLERLLRGDEARIRRGGRLAELRGRRRPRARPPPRAPRRAGPDRRRGGGSGRAAARARAPDVRRATRAARPRLGSARARALDLAPRALHELPTHDGVGPVHAERERLAVELLLARALRRARPAAPGAARRNARFLASRRRTLRSSRSSPRASASR